MVNRRKFIRQIGLSTAFISLLPDNQLFASENFVKSNLLPRSTPEEQGVSTAAIHHFFDAIEASGQEFHGTMIVKNGHVIAEAMWFPYANNHKLQLYSMSKSFTSTAIGFAQQENLLNVEDQVIKYFPKDLPAIISPNLEKLKIKHLLMMGVGMAKDSIQIIEKTDNWAKTFLSLPIDFEPGTKFLYNSGASFMLANIVQKVSGVTAHAYLSPRLFEPLCIVNSTWSTTPEGYNFGASHLRIKMEDFAKFGQFCLQNGQWNGVQLLSENYLKKLQASKFPMAKMIIVGGTDTVTSFG